MFVSEGLKINLEEFRDMCAFFTLEQLLEGTLRQIAVKNGNVLQCFIQMVKVS